MRRAIVAITSVFTLAAGALGSSEPVATKQTFDVNPASEWEGRFEPGPASRPKAPRRRRPNSPGGQKEGHEGQQGNRSLPQGGDGKPDHLQAPARTGDKAPKATIREMPVVKQMDKSSSLLMMRSPAGSAEQA